MKRKLSIFGPVIIAGFLSVTFFSLGYSKTIRKTVNAGATVIVAVHGAWSSECTTRKIRVSFTLKPKHGKVSTGRATKRISGARVGKTGGCNGKKVAGKSIRYKAAKGFKGSDSFKYKVKAPKGSFSNKVIISIR